MFSLVAYMQPVLRHWISDVEKLVASVFKLVANCITLGCVENANMYKVRLHVVFKSVANQ